ncbi:MAG: glycosyltransferase family 4 protein [Chloroflexi bacterium]|nr:glycosyltransferase family 4 protein [Chloroflexota bacterium]
MRIALDGRYIQDHFPGIGRYTWDLSRALAQAAPQHTFLIFYNPRLSNSRFDLKELSCFANVELREVSVSTLSIVEQATLPLVLRRERADLFHSPYYIRPYLLPCPAIVTVCDLIPYRYPDCFPSALTRFLFHLAMRLNVATAKEIVAISSATQHDLYRYLGVKPEKLAVVPVGVDSHRYRPLERAVLQAVRQRYRLPAHFILYVGTNKPHKNLIRLIKAFALVYTDIEHVLVIAGWWEEWTSHLGEVLAHQDLEERVRLLGQVPEDDLPALYNLADLFVFPSLYEGFGLPPLESMACGTPVVCSNTSSLPEVVGQAAITVDPYDVTQLSEAMVRVLQDNRLRDDLSAKGLRRAGQFSWTEIAQQIVSIYERIGSP